jgi:RHH-type proline utilization regulon transcriptional repressor/proline dehydrogenase/delta 1-pyrroline-5-carboxylate dehydrogenase
MLSHNPDTTQDIAALLGRFVSDPGSPHTTEVQQALFLTRELQTHAAELQTPQERRQQAEFDRMIQNSGDKATLMQMTDQAFRSNRARRAADQLIHVLDVQGIPRFFDTFDRTLLQGFQSFGSYLPGVAMPFVKEKMQHETANVILPAEPDLLRAHLLARKEEGVRMNVNHLGEALLGEKETQRRFQHYLQALQRPEIDVISVKISTIYSQISPLARQHTLEILCDRMELLYRASLKSTFERHDGSQAPKFVYLDMEEYRDKELTAEVFMQTLDRSGLADLQAGIALQAYIPDSFHTQQRINQWARQRVAAGGAPVTIRLVKGANLEMERVEASIRGWPQAPYHSKLETDANYTRMLQEAMRPENLAAVRLGVASHNLFTLAYGMVLAFRENALDKVQFEMLEGMANHQRRALFRLARNLLLYAPACRQEDFVSAVGYLVRRLDENTGPDNFLRHAFNITIDSDDWKRLERHFLHSFSALTSLSNAPQRTQNRALELEALVEDSAPVLAEGERLMHFTNEPDTDWSLPANSDWACALVEKYQHRCDAQSTQVPLVIAGETIFDDRPVRQSHDPSRPGVVVAEYRQASELDISLAVSTAVQDASGWRTHSADIRRNILSKVAKELQRARGDLTGAMLAEGGKTISESDPEISEAIDFCRFYGGWACVFGQSLGLKAQGKGVVVVVSPWNFPLAIPCGGVAAALAAGNTVILKPASDTVLVAYLLCRCFWQAGVPQTALQFTPCSGNSVGQRLVTHEDVSSVILTGGTTTARTMLAAKPNIHLLAETGGKNTTIVTALADRDQAIKNILQSALGHSGQKCSATSLVLLEDEVYHDQKFRRALCDAVESLRVGSSWELHTKVGPLIRPPDGALEKGLKELELGESWAVMPQLNFQGNPHLVTPGVKWGVRPGSLTHTTEFFGPLLGVMRFGDLHEAIEYANGTGYGLTAGLESLDDREQEIWQRAIRAGNLYVNRPTTGAIVLRQPFGGMGLSAVGPGIKAGGPNYVVPLMVFTGQDPQQRPTASGDLPADIPQPLRSEAGPIGESRAALEVLSTPLRDVADVDRSESERITAAIKSYADWSEREFQLQHDHFCLLGEDNFRRYLPLQLLRVRVHPDDSLFDVFARAAAARAVGCLTTVSIPPNLSGTVADAVRKLDLLTELWAGAIEFVEESETQLAKVICTGQTERLRYAAPSRVSNVVRKAAAESLQFVADSPVSDHGRVELLWYVREQSISRIYHRYGNLGQRSSEKRATVL